MTRDIRDITEMRALSARKLLGLDDLKDVVFHYTCPDCGRKKKITLAQDQGEYAKQFVGDKTRLDSVLDNNGRCVTCSIKAGAVAYKRMDGDGGDDDDEPIDE